MVHATDHPAPQLVQRFIIDIHPVQWRVPPFSIGRRGGKAFPIAGKDQQLAAYQEAIRDELIEQGAQMMEPPYRVEMWFWRSTAGRGTRYADATNLLKSAEDALQGAVIDNDRNNLTVVSHIIEQSKDADDRIAIEVARAASPSLPEWLTEKLKNRPVAENPQPPDNSW